MKRRIGIIGSANMDLVARVDHMPVAGENVFGADFRTIPGGKGANQAVAVARMGAQAIFIGRVGDDAFGRTLAAALRADGVDTSQLTVDPAAPSGTAMILVDRAGRNSIVICSGANAGLAPADIDRRADLLRGLDAIVMQLETPRETVVHAIHRAKAWGVPVVLDAGPPCADPPAEYFQVELLTPNHAEAAALLGRELKAWADVEAAAQEMRRRGARAAAIKMGQHGAVLATSEGVQHLRGYRVDVVDSTAAGDAFTGALAVALAEGRSLDACVRLANAAGALACTRHGAQPSMPRRRDVDDLAGHERTDAT